MSEQVDIKIVKEVFQNELKHIQKDITEIKVDNREFKGHAYSKMAKHDQALMLLEARLDKTHDLIDSHLSEETELKNRNNNRGWEIVILLVTMVLTFGGSLYIAKNYNQIIVNSQQSQTKTP